MCRDQTTGLSDAKGNYWLLLSRMVAYDWAMQGVCTSCAAAWRDAVDKQKNLENAKDTKQFIERNLVSTCKSCETREQAENLCTKLLGLNKV